MTLPLRLRNLNAFWCALVIDELVRAGVRRAVLCSGGRNAMFNLLAHAHPALRCSPAPADERCAGFLAVGMARAGGGPVLVSVTSGSAVGNLIPALMEARAAHLPLIVLTADRDQWHGATDMPQTVDQIAACAAFVSRTIDLPLPDAEAASLSSLCSLLRRQLTGLADAGPIHINLPMPAQICPTELDSGWQPATASAALSTVLAAPDAPGLHAARPDAACCNPMCLAAAARARRGLIVIGELGQAERRIVMRFVRSAGWLVMADACSGLRRSDVAELCLASMDALVLSAWLRSEPPDMVIRIGQIPVSHTMQRYLADLPAPVVKLALAPCKNMLHPNLVQSLPLEDSVLDALLSALPPPDAGWQNALLAADQRAMMVTRQQHSWCGLAVIGALLESAEYGLVHLANSLTIRLANLLLDSRSHTREAIYGARGASGIEGTLAQFFGELLVSRSDGLLILGDQAFLYDIAALQLASHIPERALIVVLNNAGGGLFDYLPCSGIEGYAAAVRGSNDCNVVAIASGFHITASRCDNPGALGDSIDAYARGTGIHLIEAVIPPSRHGDQTVLLFAAMVAAADASQREMRHDT
jgi:2-succinyl-5-enolpyruvyl-6-hydroxy-3-cyclohexene-1-carboxylate synthase